MKALKIIGKIILTIIPVVLIWVFIIAFPQNYMDGEYSYYTQTKDYIYGKTDLKAADTIVLGDSRAKSGINPMLISEDCFSLAQGGSTSIEAYYTLKHYIENMGAPKTVLLSDCAYHFAAVDGFWTRNIYFDFLSTKEANEVIDVAKDFDEMSKLCAGGEKGRFTLFEYKIKSPTKYMSAVVNSFSENRKEINQKLYKQMVDDKGFKTFVSWWPTSTEYDMEKLEILNTLDYYYRKTIDLCIENNIEVYSLNMPLIATTYNESKKIWEPFGKYFERLKNDYSGFENVHIDTTFDKYDEKYFDDADHLNEEGAKVYTKSLKERLKEDAR